MLKHINNDFQERQPIGVKTVSMEKESKRQQQNNQKERKNGSVVAQNFINYLIRLKGEKH